MDAVQRGQMVANAKAELRHVRQSEDPHEIKTFVDAVTAGVNDGWLNIEEIGSSRTEIEYLKAVASLG